MLRLSGINYFTSQMHRAILIVLIIFSGIRSLNANNGDKNKKHVCGKVTDVQTGELLPGAKIEIKANGISCYTDLNGNFYLSLPSNSKYDIEINVSGYEVRKIKSDEVSFNEEISLKQL